MAAVTTESYRYIYIFVCYVCIAVGICNNGLCERLLLYEYGLEETKETKETVGVVCDL